MFTKSTIEAYFLAEKNTQLFYILVGVLLLLLGIVLYFYCKAHHLKGGAICLLFMGIMLVLIGYIPYQQNNELRVQQVYAFDMNPSFLKSNELPRVKQYLSCTSLLHFCGFVLAILGFGTYAFLKLKKITSKWQATAFYTGMMGIIMAAISYFSYVRTYQYLEGLTSFIATF